jgi:hypothetical protein
MGEPSNNLEDWLKRVQNAHSRDDVLAILKEFRALDWTDEQRAAMSHAYIRVIENTKDSPQDQKTAAEEKQAADGPVWYEKM